MKIDVEILTRKPTRGHEGRKRKRSISSSVRYSGVKIVDHEEDEDGRFLFIIESNASRGRRTWTATEDELSQTIVRNYKGKHGLL